MNIDYKLIGERIKKARAEIGLTQEKLSERIGVTVGYISQLERGISKINLETLGKISSTLKRDVSFFLTGVEMKSDVYLLSEMDKKMRAMTHEQRRLLCRIADEILKND
ncbi:MAG: helix-turn-helix transcriptional regulator [Clostridia bacterium]|nr:helix-turn-helix transcriptional regulator [Clostridia bacterium]